MQEKKARVEPEVTFPDRGTGGGNGGGSGNDGGIGGDAAGQGPASGPRHAAGEGDAHDEAQRGGSHGAGGGLDVEDLVPGLGAEIDRHDGADAAARIAELEAENAALKDKWTRALAEAENVRRRADRDRRDAESYGGTRLARDVLAVWDNLERALKAADDDLRARHGAFIEGVELTQRELLNAFGKHKIAKVTPERGERFDPNRHQAMFEAPVPGAEPGTVIEVLQDGFTIADRLLRPALVGVSRAAPEAADGDGTGRADAAGDAPEYAPEDGEDSASGR